MAAVCMNLPPALLNGRVTRTGNIADYTCQPGFSMTSGSARSICVGGNTWNPNIAPVCTLINTTQQAAFPLWALILCAVLLSLVVIICLILACLYFCCGYSGCCGGDNRTRPSSADSDEYRYYDYERLPEKHYHGNRAVVYKAGNSRQLYNQVYVVPRNSNQEYTQYVIDAQDKSKKKPPPKANSPKKEYVEYVVENQIKTKHIPPRTVRVPLSMRSSSDDGMTLIQLTDGTRIPLDQYLKTHPKARITNQANQRVVYVLPEDNKPKPVTKYVYGRSGKHPAAVIPPGYSSPKPATVTVYPNKDGPNNGNYKNQTASKRTPPPSYSPPASPKNKVKNGENPQPGGQAKTTADQTGNEKEDELKLTDVEDEDLPESKKTRNSEHPNLAQDSSDYAISPLDDTDNNGSSNYNNNSIDNDNEEDNKNNNNNNRFMRTVFTVRDLNRFRPAKELPIWKPHTKPVRDNNTSTK